MSNVIQMNRQIPKVESLRMTTSEGLELNIPLATALDIAKGVKPATVIDNLYWQKIMEDLLYRAGIDV
jgi:hypothetical protein